MLRQQSEAIDQKISDGLKQRYIRDFPAQQAESLISFSERYCLENAVSDLDACDLDHIYASTLQLWEFVQASVPEAGSHLGQKYDLEQEDALVRVFNPESKNKEWKSPYTVVEILAKNSAFLLEGLQNSLTNRGFSVHRLFYVGIGDEGRGGAERSSFEHSSSIDKDGDQHQQLDLAIHLEIGKQHDLLVFKIIENDIRSYLTDLSRQVLDAEAMRQKCCDLASALKQSELGKQKSGPDSDKQKDHAQTEISDYLNWAGEGAFTLQAYCFHHISVRENKFELSKGESLGVLKSSPDSLDLVPEVFEKQSLAHKRIVFVTSRSQSVLDRIVNYQVFIVRKFDFDGAIVGEHRFFGVFNSVNHFLAIQDTPILREKYRFIVNEINLRREVHKINNVTQILSAFPKWYLFHMEMDELLSLTKNVRDIQGGLRTRLFVHVDAMQHFASCLVFTPSETFNSNLREMFQVCLKSAFSSNEIRFNTHFSDLPLARVHFFIRLPRNKLIDIDEDDLEQELDLLAKSWPDRILESLLADNDYNEIEATRLLSKYRDCFPLSYQEDFSQTHIVDDIRNLELINVEAPFIIKFSCLQNGENLYQLRLYHNAHSISPAEVIPILEGLNLHAVEERPYKIKGKGDSVCWIHNYIVNYQSSSNIYTKDTSKAEGFVLKLEDAFKRIWEGEIENDNFNRLVLGAGLSIDEVVVIRAFCRYLKQVGYIFNQDFQEKTLTKHPALSRMLIEIFKVRYSPNQKFRQETYLKLHSQYSDRLIEVKSLEEDKVLAKYLSVVNASVRCNYFSFLAKQDEFFVMKVDASKMSSLPKPVPFYETFLYSPTVEGVHLRGGKVARGGLRWSERYEDYRTEVLNLLKAQQVKNSLIVPVGAKGGFVAKRLNCNDGLSVGSGGPNGGAKEVLKSYQIFIRGLLTLCDNMLDGKVIPPKGIVCWDGSDPYLVVAADKGTASFSDEANKLSRQYGFWLDDAFASGGTSGFDHKKLGITAKGAWVAVNQHLREQGFNLSRDRIRTLAIGDMSGDVFGNGMIENRCVDLIAAFDARYIFIDPNPKGDESYEERLRLFRANASTWLDYSKDLISEGGGVFLRSEKSIKLSSQIQNILGSEEQNLSPDMLIKCLLTMKVDLLWFGGIGTYVKSEKENNDFVGDKHNKAIRVNGEDLNANVVAEGGNLGLTQFGRIEFASKGGAINADFIDNAGGVICSDHEVNIKILLNEALKQKCLDLEERDELLASLTKDITHKTLKQLRYQVEMISILRKQSVSQMPEMARYICSLEERRGLDRKDASLPTPEQFVERQESGLGLTRPELATLFCHSKGALKSVLTESDVYEEPYIIDTIVKAFPKVLRQRFLPQLIDHPLKREIISAQLANEIVNLMGVNFIHRMKAATGSDAVSVAKAYFISKTIFDLDECWHRLSADREKLRFDDQAEIHLNMQRLIRRSTRWLLRNNRSGLNIADSITKYQGPIRSLKVQYASLLQKRRLSTWNQEVQTFNEQGIELDFAQILACHESLPPLLRVIGAAELENFEIKKLTQLYFILGARLKICWLSEKIEEQAVSNEWQALARESYRDDLGCQQCALTVLLMKMICQQNKKPTLEVFGETIDAWFEDNPTLLERWFSLNKAFDGAEHQDFSVYAVAIRELLTISQTMKYKLN